MKKIFILAAAVFFTAGITFAQTAAAQPLEATDSYADKTTNVIQIEDKYADMHPKASSVTLQLEWTPLTGEALFTYTCTQSSFDIGEAMNVGIAVYEEFAAENNLKHKQYAEKDRTKYFKDDNGIRMATYTSKVIFTK